MGNFHQECTPYLQMEDGKALQLDFLILHAKLKVRH